MALVQKAFSDIITFSRSSNATRVGPTGLVQYAPHNLILQSQTFDNAAWLKSNSSITANAIAAPDGTVTADKLVEAATTSVHSATQTVTFAANFIYTTSVYAKAGERSFLIIQPTGDSRFAYYNLSNGTVGTVNGSPLSTQIQSVGNNWYRCTITVTSPGATAANCILYSAATDGNATYTGDGTSGIYIWGAQLAVGPYALDYTPTTSAAVYGPRFDFDPVTLAARGLLVEEQRTNLCLYSEQFDNAWWSKTTATVTANSIASPDGTLTADLVTATAGGGGATVISSAITVAASTAYTYSIFIKTGTATSIQLRLTDNVTGQALITANLLTGATTISAGPYGSVTASSVEYANGWRRFIVTGTQPSGQTSASVGVYLLNNADTVYLWGAQLEAGSFATSYIPTLASTVTRSADVASVNTLSPWWNATESTIYSEFDTFSTNDAFPYSFGTKNNNEIGTYRIGSNGNVATLMFASTVLQNNSTIATGTALNATIKAAYAIKANDLAGSANGGAAVTDTTATLPSVSTLYLGSRDDGTGPLNGHLRRLAVYPRRLTNAELQALTA